jgi:cytochrome c5
MAQDPIMSDTHSSLIKTPKQLVIVVVLAFVIPIALIVMISQLATSHSKGTAERSEEAVLQRIKPVGTLVVEETGAAQTLQTGQQVVQTVCSACHGAGIAGAPKMGDKTAWAPLLKQGYNTLLEHALKGNQRNGATMPPKGGNSNLDDTEVARAVVFLANQAGANFPEPAAKPVASPPPAAAAATPATAAPAPAVAATPTPPAPAQTTAAGDGKAIYDKVCVACHGTGAAGAPKAGDRAAWAPRLKSGIPALYNSALKGKNAMPAKGGNASLSDADVKAAVDYLAGLAK